MAASNGRASPPRRGPDPPPRLILHLDLDAFFAAVEQRDHPEWRGRPVVVGGPSHRGVVATASYEARVFGVHSAMPMVEALRRCPRAVVAPPRRRAYEAASQQVFAIFHRFTPLVEGLSIDEAFLDVTSSQSLFGSAETIAQEIKQAIQRETGLTGSAGVAPCKFVAKLASEKEKPDGLVVVRPERVRDFLWPLPIEQMWGVGPVAAQRLHNAGLDTLGQIARADPAYLTAVLGKWGAEIHQLANGIDDRPVEPHVAAKSVGAEETFDQDLRARADIERHLLAQAQRVARRLWQSQLSGRVVMVKIKYRDFVLRTRQLRLSEPVMDTDSIYRAARQLLDGFDLSRPVRLTGVAVSELSVGPPPPTLFPDAAQQKGARLEQLSNAIRARFGGQSLTRATLLDGPGAAHRHPPGSSGS